MSIINASLPLSLFYHVNHILLEVFILIDRFRCRRTSNSPIACHQLNTDLEMKSFYFNLVSRKLIARIRLQMDGLTRTEDLVFVLAATNLPWELDAAMLRRLEKRVSFCLLLSLVLFIHFASLA